MATKAPPATAASSTWTDEDGVRRPGADAHAWLPGTNQTLCGLSLHRTRLGRFPHVLWIDTLWLADTSAHRIVPCRRCVAAAGGRSGARRWMRVNPRP